MPRTVAYDWLVAETEAWPLWSAAALRRRTLRLDRVSVGCLDEATRGLAEDLEEWVRPRSAGWTLHMLRQVRDNAWFPDGRRALSMADHAVRLAETYLDVCGPRPGLREEDGRGNAERAGRWRWMSYVLPEDLLVAAHAAADRRAPQGETVGLLTPHLHQVLREGKVAETHLHVGAAVPFPWLWTSLLATLGEDPPTLADLRWSGVPAAFGDEQGCLRHLLAAAIARLLLAEYLRRRETTLAVFPDFDAFVFGDKEAGGVAMIARWLAWPDGAGEGVKALVRALGVLAGDGKPPLAELSSLYRRLLGPRPRRFDRSDLAALMRRDPLWDATPPAERQSLPETAFASRALRHLLGPGREDRLFELIFWQYQRVRCLTFRHLVEEPGTGGLDWFSRHYMRISALRKGIDGAIFRSALESEAVDCNLASLEVRMVPPDNAQEVLRTIGQLAGQTLAFQKEREMGGAPETEGPEVGLVFHFIKDWFAEGGKRLHAEPVEGEPFCRYGSWYYPRLRQAMAIEAALDRVPEILLLLRGLDIANHELAIPTWVSLPLFARVRKASIRASQRVARTRPGWRAEPLRITAHLGEDFVRLVQGLRRIHEPIEFGLLGLGSRIGHAVALGHDPALWAAACVSVPQTLEERLEDLLWELDRYGHADLPAEIGRLEYVRSEATRLAGRIYGDRVDVYEALEARRRLHDPALLELWEYPLVRPSRDRQEGPFRLLWLHLTDPGVFERGQKKIEVLADEGEVRFLKAAQQWLRRVLGRLEITVESNPSSNLLIGDFQDLKEHPAFRLHPLASGRTADESPVLLSVNVDDPITFASNLANEFAHIYFALTRRKVASEEALEWLARVRDHGWRSRFTLPASGKAENLREIASLVRLR
jgi:hypothetical protein